MSGKRSRPSIWAWRGALVALVAAGGLVVVAGLGAWLLLGQSGGDGSATGRGAGAATVPVTPTGPPSNAPTTAPSGAPPAAIDVLVGRAVTASAGARSGVPGGAGPEIPSVASSLPVLGEPSDQQAAGTPGAVRPVSPEGVPPGTGHLGGADPSGAPSAAPPGTPSATPSATPSGGTRGCSAQAPGHGPQGGAGAGGQPSTPGKPGTPSPPDVRQCHGGPAPAPTASLPPSQR